PPPTPPPHQPHPSPNPHRFLSPPDATANHPTTTTDVGRSLALAAPSRALTIAMSSSLRALRARLRAFAYSGRCARGARTGPGACAPRLGEGARGRGGWGGLPNRQVPHGGRGPKPPHA